MNRHVEPPRRERDQGMGLVEVLVAIVLLGLGAIGTLGAMKASITASSEHRSLTNGQTWLQSATDFLQAQPREDCDDLEGEEPGDARERIRQKYQDYVRLVENPDNWDSELIEVLDPVLFWDGDQYQSVCYDNFQINLQLVSLKVTSPDGKYTRTLQVVKNG